MNKKILLVMLLGILMFSFASAVLADDIVSYYKLDEASGSVLDSLTTNDLTNNGATTNVAGIIKTAYSLDGTNDYIGNLTASAISASAYTINMWIKNNGDTSMDFFGSQGSGGTNGLTFEYGGNCGAGKFGVVHVGVAVHCVTIGTLSSDWKMITVTYDGTNSRLYINNSNVGNATMGFTPSVVSYLIGARNNNGVSTSYFDGVIDEVGIWNRALNTSELSELYNSGNGSSYPFTSGSIPTVDLLTPLNNSKQTSSIINFTANVTVDSGFNNLNQTIFIWNENGSIFYNNTLTEDYNLTIEIEWSTSGFELGMDYIWNVFACGNDSECNWADSNFTFTSSAFSEYNVTYETSVLETDNKQFNLTINSTGVDEVSSIFWYNGSSYSAITIDLGSGNYKAIRSIDIPLQNTTGNKSFHWQFDFILTNQNSLQQNSTIYSQEVNRTFFQLCNATYNTKFVNFTTRDAENPFPTQVSSFKSAWNWYVTTGSGTVSRNLSYEDVTETKSNYQFCASPNVTYNINADLEIDADGFAQNYYFLVDSQLSNDTTNINLYLLNDSLATPTTLEVKDKYQSPIEGMLIHIQLYDVGTDTFYTVGMSRTNNNGEDNFYFNWYDSLYKFILIQDGETILNTNVTKIFETPKKFQILEDTTYSFDKFQDFEYSLTFDEITNLFSLTFVKPSGEVEQGCLRVIKRTSTEDTQICLTCSSSTSATVFCDISSAGNGTFIAAFYATGSWFMVDWVDEIIGATFAEGINELLNQDDAAFYTILLIGVVLSMFLFSAVLGIIGAILGLLAAGSLGFTVLSYSLYLGIVIIGGVIIWILKK